MSRLDGVIVLFLLAGSIVPIILHASSSVAINRVGWLYNGLGLYFLARCLIRRWVDLESVALGLAVLSIPVALAFVVENKTGRNAFSIFGGVPEITVARAGRLRCQGAFVHPILAGCFWASAMPLIAGLWMADGAKRWLCLVGIIMAMVIVLMCASSTPIAVIAVGLFGGLLYGARRWLRLLRWCALGGVIALQLSMQAPVWHLLARVRMVGGSTGWHRFYLIDQAIAHFEEWALLGTKSTAHWGHQLFDLTNQYVVVAVQGGLLTLVLFVGIIVVAFGEIGQMLKSRSVSTSQRMTAWLLGVALLMHTIAFIAVSYRGEILIVWYLLLGGVGSLAMSVKQDRIIEQRMPNRRMSRPSDMGGVAIARRHHGWS